MADRARGWRKFVVRFVPEQSNLDNAHAVVIIVRHSGLYGEPIIWQNGVKISSLRDALIYCGAVL